MIPLCLIVGDSTGLGTASALAAQRIQCELHARVGASSADVARTWKGSPVVARALVAIGSNDPTNPSLTRNLVSVRQRITAARVTWLLPYNTSAARVVATVATSFGDQIVPLSAQPSTDRVHPRSYRALAASLGWKDVFESRSIVSAPPAYIARPARPIEPRRRRQSSSCSDRKGAALCLRLKCRHSSPATSHQKASPLLSERKHII